MLRIMQLYPVDNTAQNTHLAPSPSYATTTVIMAGDNDGYV